MEEAKMNLDPTVPYLQLINPWNTLSASEEAKLLKKLSQAEKCPYHDIVPEIVGPERRLDYGGDGCIDLGAAMLFPLINWTCFCPKCAVESPTLEKHNQFGFGYCSQHSWQAALGNWNKACSRACKKLIMQQLKGTAALKKQEQ